MKLSRLIQTLSAAMLTMAGASAHALVEAGHWQTQPNLGNTNAYVAIDQTPGGDFTGTFFNYDQQNGTLQFITLNLDEGSELFLTSPGAVLTNETIAALPATAFFGSPVQVGTDFYLGGRTRTFGEGFTWDKPDFYTTYGWAHIRVDAGGLLQVVDSAMAFREGGIIVGTTQAVAVPEPSTYLLVSAGLLGIGLARQRRHKV